MNKSSSQTVSITLDANLDRRVLVFQARLIAATKRNWSYSAVLNLLIEEGLKVFPFRKMSVLKKK